jgi:eukaryotic-like serine/threonine-protein kinase
MVADFGLARVYQASKLSGLTLLGDVGGSVGFMPPEQILNYREAKPSADQYSAAATLYTLLTGQFVHDLSGSFTGRIDNILKGKPVPIQEWRTDLPRGLAAVIHRALAYRPESRFADVAAFRRTLLPFCK